MLHQAAILIQSAIPSQVTEKSLQALSSAKPIQAASAASPNFFFATLQMVAALSFVLALILGLAWLAKKYLPSGIIRSSSGDRIDLLASRPLGLRRSLMVVRTRGRVFLVGATPQQISCLSEWDEEGAGDASADLTEQTDEKGRALAIESFQQLLAKRQDIEREKPK